LNPSAFTIILNPFAGPHEGLIETFGPDAWICGIFSVGFGLALSGIDCTGLKLDVLVTAGQEIAKIGMTGYTYLPHLHFQVFVFTGPNLWEDYQTLKVDF
jgi:hypothetical protein